MTEDGFLRVAERVLARRDVALVGRAAGVAAADLRAGAAGMMTLYVLGSGSRGQLLRGRVGRHRAPDRRGLQRARDRAAGGDRRSRAGHDRRDRAHPRARRSRLRRRPAGSAARCSGADRARAPGPASRRGCAMPSTARSVSAPGWRSVRSSSRPAPPVTMRPSRSPWPWRRPTASGSAWRTTWAGRRPPSAICCATSRAIVLEANHDEVLLRTSQLPAGGATPHRRARPATSAIGPRRELLAEVHHPGLGVVVLAHLSQQCNTADDARAAVAPALRRAGFNGELHVADQDQPLGPILVVRSAGIQFDLAL